MIRSSRKYRCGYILFEAVVSMAILSLSVVGIHRVMREAIITRGQSHDYTMAKFFAEEVMSTLQSLAVITFALAAIFVPQVLALYLNERPRSESA